MSRIGKRPVAVPSGVTATIDGQIVKMKGPKGELEFTAPEEVLVEKTDDGIEVKPVVNDKRSQSMWGMSRTRIFNLVHGVSEGYSKTLEIQGVGYRGC